MIPDPYVVLRNNDRNRDKPERTRLCQWLPLRSRRQKPVVELGRGADPVGEARAVARREGVIGAWIPIVRRRRVVGNPDVDLGATSSPEP